MTKFKVVIISTSTHNGPAFHLKPQIDILVTVTVILLILVPYLWLRAQQIYISGKRHFGKTNQFTRQEAYVAIECC